MVFFSTRSSGTLKIIYYPSFREKVNRRQITAKGNERCFKTFIKSLSAARSVLIEIPSVLYALRVQRRSCVSYKIYLAHVSQRVLINSSEFQYSFSMRANTSLLSVPYTVIITIFVRKDFRIKEYNIVNFRWKKKIYTRRVENDDRTSLVRYLYYLPRIQ